jgi:hypothetical protein
MPCLHGCFSDDVDAVIGGLGSVGGDEIVSGICNEK